MEGPFFCRYFKNTYNDRDEEDMARIDVLYSNKCMDIYSLNDIRISAYPFVSRQGKFRFGYPNEVYQDVFKYRKEFRRGNHVFAEVDDRIRRQTKIEVDGKIIESHHE